MSTKRKLLSETSADLSNHLFENSPLGICILCDDQIELANTRFCKLFSMPKTKLIGKPINFLFSKSHELEKLQKLRPFIVKPVFEKSGTPVEINIQPSELETNDGTKKILLYADWLIPSLDLSDADEIASIVSAFNLTPSLVLVLDENTNILNINDTALQLAQESRSTAVGLQPGNVLKCVRSTDSPDGCGHGPICKKCIIRHVVQESLRTGKSNLRIESPFSFKRRNSIVTLTVQLSSIAFKRNGKRNVLVSIDDITQLKDLENKLLDREKQLLQKNNELKSLNNRLLDSLNRIKKINDELRISKIQAEESDQLKSAFLGNLSHEIRTPLNGILGFIELLNDKNDKSGQHIQYSSIINQNADQLLQIVNDVVEISRIETQQVELNLKDVHINNLLRKLHCHYLIQTEAKDIELNLHLGASDEDCIIFADKYKIQQSLNNLLNNALKFTSRGCIDFGYRNLDEEKEFFVKDTGIGIDKKLHTEIFKHFRQAELRETRSYGGLGLGLPIAQAWTKIQGGKIWLESTPGKGSSFFFTIPDSVNSHKSHGDVLKKNESKEREEKKRTILIVEDEEYNMLFLREMLKNSNVRILTATNGQEAIEICENDPDIDLVLMDIKLPLVDGYTATRKIKSNCKKLPVIAHTAYAMVNAREKALKAGCDEYISKPVRSQEILKLVNKYL